jgi:lysine-N-methylase
MENSESIGDAKVRPEDTAASPAPAATEIHPTYAGAFRCIGPSCEDHCCGDWVIPVDKQTYEKYQQFPPGPVRTLVERYVTITDPKAPENIYARINRTPTGLCGFFASDGLCDIHRTAGAEALPATCSIYPRALTQVDGVLEGSLYLSCPEAARNILLVPDSTQAESNLYSGDFRTDDFAWLPRNEGSSIYKPYYVFSPLRALLIAMVRDRARPLWQRLLLIGALCERLDAITSNEQQGAVLTILRDYWTIVRRNQLMAELDALPNAPQLQLAVILRLTVKRRQDMPVSGRFSKTIDEFMRGLGGKLDAGSGPTPADHTERYIEAREKYQRPYFEKSPFILENYLLNYIFQTLFPFGRTGSPYFIPQRIMDEYILMATQFAWMNALLIGVAGFHKEDFGDEHVVHTVQSFSRAVEHYPFFLVSVKEHLQELQLSSLNGMAVLLKP